ncbi:hypothetical protein QJS10_CPA09g00774 [Acorus calamus]|uniref:Terpene synthase N-terminal domain-containing protein n=1 Tax=Acorus calamus TaxID=4465 RepID=A0AAV9E7M1_ACOCL|nr:hypothetical protein QJS10_CPA09g00774 [Acorus calamus]
MASTIGFHVCSGLPIKSSPKKPAPRTVLRISSIATQNEATASSSVVVPRRSGNYSPNIWDHRFLQSLKNDYAEDVFRSFKLTTDCFMDNMCYDIKGILSLYEASYHGFEGEEIVDEARAFTCKFFKEYLKQDEINPILKEQLVHALALPRHWRVKWLESHW